MCVCGILIPHLSSRYYYYVLLLLLLQLLLLVIYLIRNQLIELGLEAKV